MIIKKIRLENYGLYQGIQEFDLATEEDKNIILIGGKNGNGKTTFFEAIQLGLYGPRIFNKKSKTKYDNFLLSKIHHNPLLNNQPKQASIEINFEYSSLGEVYNYNIRRTWEKVKKNIKETLTIKKNNKLLNDIDSEEWQDFINDLIPYGLVKLFFFDGEKIQNLAEEMNDNNELSNSFKSLLGLDLIDKLKKDLKIYSIKQLNKRGKKDLNKKIKEAQKKVKLSFGKLEDFNLKKAHILSKIDNIKINIERQEELIKKEGGAFANKRDSLKENVTVLNTKIESIDEQIRNLCSDLLPFTFAPKLCKKLSSSLKIEETLQNNKIALDSLQKSFNMVKKDLTKSISKETNIDSKKISYIYEKILNKIRNSFKQDNSLNIIHSLSNENRILLIDSLNKSLNSIKQEFLYLIKTKEKMLTTWHKNTKQLSYVPLELVITPYIEKVAKLNKELGQLQQKLSSINEDIRKANFIHDSNESQLERLYEEMKKENDLDYRMKLVNKLDTILDQYHSKLKKQKLEEFSSMFIEIYNLLSRKKDVFKKILINPENFSVIFYKGNDKIIKKSELSAGEKQIYAISVLWTLTKMSKKPLPFMIDTPLGRLDLNHRANLITNFFPNASHQVIILSTDTEIGPEYVKELNNNISKKYLLNFENHSTEVKQGYFFGDKND